jgi:hypothetical protein
LAKIEVTPEQKKELDSKGFVAKPAVDIVSNRRSYWDPRKDEKGNVFGWTHPLPGDTVRMNFYLRKGFKLEDPEGHIAPPPGYFNRRMPAIPSPAKAHEVGTGKGEIGQKGETTMLQCPICQKEFPDADTLVHHMTYHRSKGAKKKAKKTKRAKLRGKHPEGG